MQKFMALIKKHPVLAYYALVFVISWGSILIVLGPSDFMGTAQTSSAQLFFGGPLSLLGPSIAGFLLTVLLYGKTGLHDLLARLLRWKVGIHWYGVVLLTAPLLTLATLFVLSLTPAIITANDKVNLLVSGFTIGLIVPLFEEIGWTGFAIPEIRKYQNILTTGIIMGLLWGLWHFPMFSASASASGPVPPALYLAVMLFSWLVPYRVLMVWVYDHTRSLLLAMLMHVPIIVVQFVLRPQTLSGKTELASLLIYTAMLWVFVMIAVKVPQALSKVVKGVPTVSISNQKGAKIK